MVHSMTETWTAPVVDRTESPNVAPERTAAEALLDYFRETLLWKCAGLSADQLKQRSVSPSSMSLLGLVRHMAEVERVWFRTRIAGEGVGPIYCSEAGPTATSTTSTQLTPRPTSPRTSGRSTRRVPCLPPAASMTRSR